jgi:type I restriction enzyme S subunit
MSIDLLNSVLPEGWELRKITDLFYVNQYTLPANTDQNLEFNYLTIESVSTEEIDYSLVNKYRFKDAPSRARRVLKNGDILIATVRPNLKSFVIFKRPGDELWVCSTGFSVLTPKPDVYPPFYFYQILGDIGAKQFYSFVAGTNYPAINESDVKKIKLLKPPLLIEKSIGRLIESISEAIQATNASIRAAETLKKALMQHLLTGKLRPDGAWRKEEDFYTDEKFGNVPKGWIVGRFKEFSVLQRGKDLTDKDVKPGSYPVVKSNGIQIYHNEFFVEPPGVVTGRSGTIGKVFYITEKFWAHNTTLYIKDFKGNDEKFIYYLIMRMKFDHYFAGTTIPTLNRNDIHKVRVAIPKLEEQGKIANRLTAMDELLSQKQTKIQTLERLKKALMQRLLTGKVRVKV